jgi:hypothetical protein
MGKNRLPLTLARLRQHYYWVGSKEDCNVWVDGCTCHISKLALRNIGELGRVPVGDIFCKVHFDFLEVGVVGRHRGCKYVLGIHWPLSGKSLFRPLQSKDTALVAKQLLLDTVMRSPKAPNVMVSDNAQEFISQTMHDLGVLAKIHLRTTAVENPKANTYAERPIQSFNSLLQALLGDRDLTDWDHPDIEETINYMLYHTPSRSRSFLTPAFIESGADATMGLDLVLSEYAPKFKDKSLQGRISMLQEARRLVLEAHGIARDQSAEVANRGSSENRFQVGDKVWVHRPGAKRAQGPYRIASWRQAERRTAVLTSLQNDSDGLVTPVRYLVKEEQVPEERRLEYEPVMLKVYKGLPGPSSIQEMVEEQQDIYRQKSEDEPELGQYGQDADYQPEEDEIAGARLKLEPPVAEAKGHGYGTRSRGLREPLPEGVFVVKRIVNHRDDFSSGDRVRQYRVRWQDHEADDDTWEARDKLLLEAPQAVDNYERSQKPKRRFKPMT